MDVICGTLVDNKVASQAMGKKRDWSINDVSGKKIKLDQDKFIDIDSLSKDSVLNIAAQVV